MLQSDLSSLGGILYTSSASANNFKNKFQLKLAINFMHLYAQQQQQQQQNQELEKTNYISI
jgi:hypothetical protein